MNRQFQYMGSGHPSDPRWHKNSTPGSKWCVTRRSPVMQLLAAGKTWGFTMSMPPPEALIGHKIGLHVGVGNVPLKHIADSARFAIATLNGLEFDDWRAGLSKWETNQPGAFVGSATLVAAFRVGGLHQECVSPYRVDSLGHTYLGDWQRFYGRQIRPVGEWNQSRWCWAFDKQAQAPANGENAARCKGFAWVWDATRGVKVRNQNGLVA